MKRFAWIVGMTLALHLVVACKATDSMGASEALAAQSAVRPCGAADLVELLDMTRFVMLGEHYGTREGPAFALEVVRTALCRGSSVTIGFEIPHDEQGAFDKYLACAGTAEDRAELLKGRFWRLLGVDGRGSQAMLALVESVRSLASSGQPVELLCFDVGNGASLPGERDAFMAERILHRRLARPDSVFLILVGGSHAATTESPWGAAMSSPPQGWYLAGDVPDLVTLRMRYGSGSAWCWFPGSDPGIQPMAGDGVDEAHGVQRFAEPDEQGFHGVFDVGATTASRPANPLAGQPVFDMVAGR